MTGKQLKLGREIYENVFTLREFQQIYIQKIEDLNTNLKYSINQDYKLTPNTKEILTLNLRSITLTSKKLYIINTHNLILKYVIEFCEL